MFPIDIVMRIVLCGQSDHRSAMNCWELISNQLRTHTMHVEIVECSCAYTLHTPTQSESCISKAIVCDTSDRLYYYFYFYILDARSSLYMRELVWYLYAILHVLPCLYTPAHVPPHHCTICTYAVVVMWAFTNTTSCYMNSSFVHVVGTVLRAFVLRWMMGASFVLENGEIDVIVQLQIEQRNSTKSSLCYWFSIYRFLLYLFSIDNHKWYIFLPNSLEPFDGSTQITRQFACVPVFEAVVHFECRLQYKTIQVLDGHEFGVQFLIGLLQMTCTLAE